MIDLPPGFYDPTTLSLRGPQGERRVTPTMHRILVTLAAAKGRPVPYGTMIERLWRPNDEPNDAEPIIKIMVCRMRVMLRDIGIDRSAISTRHHIGYFLAPAPAAPAISITAEKRERLRQVLETHPDRALAEPLLPLLD